MQFRLRAVAIGVVAVASVMGAAGSARAASTTAFHCQASAMRVTVAGQQTVEPVKVGADGGCGDAQGTPAVQVPSLLTAKALTADTAFDAAKTVGTAEGGILSLSLAPTPDQLSQLPTEQVIANLPNTTITVSEPLAGALAAAGLPTSIALDLRDAVQALVPTPGTALLSADVLTSKATIGCQNGAPSLDGSSTLTGAKLAGQDLGLDGPLDQLVTLIDSQSISPASLDLSKIHIVTPLDGITQPLLAQLQAAIGPALAALPPISLPASILDVKLTPNEQIRNGNSLVQRALHAQVSVGGQQLIDAVFGEAMVSGTASACAAAAGAVGQQVLQCTDRKLVLVDVLPQGRRVKLLGYANRDYVGRRVAIRLRATGKVVAHALVHRDGSFSTSAAAPPRSMLATHARANRVRYRAEIGRELSLPLKLQRRMRVTSMRSSGGRVTITGRVVRPLTTPVSQIRVVRRVSCHKVVLVARVKPRHDGTFRVTVKAPKNAAAAVYRLATRVREKPSNPRVYPTFTLPRGVALNTR